MWSVDDGIPKAVLFYCRIIQLERIYPQHQVHKFAIMEISGQVTMCGTFYCHTFSPNLVLLDPHDYLHDGVYCFNDIFIELCSQLPRTVKSELADEGRTFDMNDSVNFSNCVTQVEQGLRANIGWILVVTVMTNVVISSIEVIASSPFRYVHCKVIINMFSKMIYVFNDYNRSIFSQQRLIRNSI